MNQMNVPVQIVHEHQANLWPPQNICSHDCQVLHGLRHRTSSDHIDDSVGRLMLISGSPNDVFPATVYWFHRSSHEYEIHRDQLQIEIIISRAIELNCLWGYVRLKFTHRFVSGPLSSIFLGWSPTAIFRIWKHLCIPMPNMVVDLCRRFLPLLLLAIEPALSWKIANWKSMFIQRHWNQWLSSNAVFDSLLTSLFLHFVPKNNCKEKKICFNLGPLDLVEFWVMNLPFFQ